MLGEGEEYVCVCVCVCVCVEGGETEVIEAIYYLNTQNLIMEHLHSHTFYKNKT